MMSAVILDLYCLLTSLMVIGLVVWGLQKGGSTSKVHHFNRVVWGVGLVLLAWYLISVGFAIRGIYQASVNVKIPALPFAIFLPVILGLTVIFRSKTAQKIVDSVPLSWLVGVQSYRVLGGIFLVLYFYGKLPGQFALPSGIGDVLVGLMAFVLLFSIKKIAKPSFVIYVWNILGILDFMDAIATGIMTSPGKLQVMSLSHPNILATAYPLVLIPIFIVPLSFILHGICIWKLQRS